jgi:D-alanine transfer protein
MATAILGASLVGAQLYAHSVEADRIHAVAPLHFDLKYQGTQLQEMALEQPDLLLVYGSSELEMPNPYHASSVFENYPTGFTIFPIGRGETTSLVMLQDVAGLGSEMRGKKIAISVSPPWFFVHDRPTNFYRQNLSALHLSALVFSTDLSTRTKQLAVRELRQSPALFANDPLVAFAADQLASEGLIHQLAYLAVLPLGKLQNAALSLQDLWATLAYLQTQPLQDPPARQESRIDWTALTEQARQEQQEASNSNDLGFDNEVWRAKYERLVAERTGQFNDADFLDTLDHNPEFADLGILLGGLRELGAEPLVLSQPIAGKYYDTIGISAAARSEYYLRLRQVAAAYQVPEVDFANHDYDIYFVSDPNSHLSREGWVYYDRALQAFYDGTLEVLARTNWSADAVLPADFAGAPAPLR